MAVPLDEFPSNLRTIAASLAAQGVPRVIIIGPPPIDDALSWWVDGARWERGCMVEKPKASVRAARPPLRGSAAAWAQWHGAIATLRTRWPF